MKLENIVIVVPERGYELFYRAQTSLAQPHKNEGQNTNALSIAIKDLEDTIETENNKNQYFAKIPELNDEGSSEINLGLELEIIDDDRLKVSLYHIIESDQETDDDRLTDTSSKLTNKKSILTKKYKIKPEDLKDLKTIVRRNQVVLEYRVSDKGNLEIFSISTAKKTVRLSKRSSIDISPIGDAGIQFHLKHYYNIEQIERLIGNKTIVSTAIEDNILAPDNIVNGEPRYSGSKVLEYIGEGYSRQRKRLLQSLEYSTIDSQTRRAIQDVRSKWQGLVLTPARTGDIRKARNDAQTIQGLGLECSIRYISQNLGVHERKALDLLRNSITIKGQTSIAYSLEDLDKIIEDASKHPLNSSRIRENDESIVLEKISKLKDKGLEVLGIYNAIEYLKRQYGLKENAAYNVILELTPVLGIPLVLYYKQDIDTQAVRYKTSADNKTQKKWKP